jgi:hypothetical protein
MKKGDTVKLTSLLEEYPLEIGAEGTVIDFEENENEALVDFGTPGSFHIRSYDLRVAKPKSQMNERELMKEEYREWVDRVSDECDWKTSFTIEEINEKWSEIALRYALKIVEDSLELNSNQKLSFLIDKKDEIKNLL